MTTSTATPPEPIRLLDFLRQRGGFTTEDVLATLLPLFRQVQQTHEAGRVAPLEGLDEIWVDDYRAYFEASKVREPRSASARVRGVEGRLAAFQIVGQRVLTTEADAGDETHDNLLVAKPAPPWTSRRTCRAT